MCHLLCSAGRRANCRRAVSLQLAGKAGLCQNHESCSPSKVPQAGLRRAAAASRRAGDEAAWDDKVLRRNQSVQPCHAAVVYKVWLSAGVGGGKLLPASRRKCIQVYPAIR